MSSVNDAMYSRNSASTVVRSSGQRASVIRIAIADLSTGINCARPRQAGTRLFQISGFPAYAGMSGDLRQPNASDRNALRVHRVEELAVRLSAAQLVEQEVDRIHGAHRIEDAAQDVHLLELLRLREQFFLARTRTRDVDCREGALVGNLTIEDELGVARALELLEDHFVHARAGVDQRGRDDGERAALFDVTCRTEEALRTLQRIGVDTAGQHLAG